MAMRGCKRCGAAGPLRSGVHFVISVAATGECLATYDVCAECMTRRSPLIIPAEARRPGVMQYDISYSGFGGYQHKPDSGGPA